jgi:hypothetical protein
MFTLVSVYVYAYEQNMLKNDNDDVLIYGKYHRLIGKKLKQNTYLY